MCNIYRSITHRIIRLQYCVGKLIAVNLAVIDILSLNFSILRGTFNYVDEDNSRLNVESYTAVQEKLVFLEYMDDDCRKGAF